MVRIDSFLSSTEAEGPGRRACLWVQGCSLRCAGCFNPHTWNPSGGTEVPVDRILAAIDSGPEIEGITLLGGEPFEQAVELAHLATEVRRRGLSVMTFTGYTLAELRNQERVGVAELLAVTDLLLDGRYESDLPDLRRPWVGSTNQRFHFLTDRYRHLAGRLASIPDRLEIHIRPDGTVFVNGQAGDAELHGLLEALELRRSPARRNVGHTRSIGPTVA